MAVVYLFDEILLDPAVVLGGDGSPVAAGSPEFANTVIRSPGTGARKINVNRVDALEILNLDISLVTRANLEYLLKMWRGGYGNAVGFRMRVPWDFTALNEVFGVGDGSTTQFNLVKTYTRPGVTARQDVRRIIKPVTNTNISGGVTLYEPDGANVRTIPSTSATNLGIPGFTIKKAGVATSAYTINNTTGRITFTTAPANGATLTWSGEFDIPAAFADDTFPITSFGMTSEVKGMRFEEIHYSELGIT
jgi:hypothetical protein